MPGADEATREGFELLSDGKRLETLRVLAERLKENPDDPTLEYGELRRRVGLRTSENFNYHLDRLVGTYVEKTEAGYRIAPSGMEITAAIIAGVYGDGSEIGPATLDEPCPTCGEPLEAEYRDDLFEVSCPAGHEFKNTLPPGAVEDRDLDEALELLSIKTKQDLSLAVDGVCPFCYATIEWSIGPDDLAGTDELVTQCARCGVRIEVPPVVTVLDHPAVVAFYHDHGVDIRKRPLWAPELARAVEARLDADPVRLRVTIAMGDERLTATLDRQLSVLDIERR